MDTANLAKEISEKVLLPSIVPVLLNTGAKKIAAEAAKTAVSEASKNNMQIGIGSFALLEAVKNIDKLPKILVSIVNSLGYGGFQRGQAAGFTLGQAAIVETVKREIALASVVEVANLCLQIVSLNPATNAIKNVIVGTIAVGSAVLVIKGAAVGVTALSNYQLAHQAIASLKELSLGKAKELLNSGVISNDKYLGLVKEISNIKNVDLAHETFAKLTDFRR